MPKRPRKHGLLYVLSKLPRLLKGHFPVFLDYPIHPHPRYGYGKPPHPQLDAMFAHGANEYRERLHGFLGAFQEPLLRIAAHAPESSPEPCWINKWLEGLDTFALYCFAASRGAKTYLEVGSGYSTKVVRRAIKDHGLKTRMTSIDPHPRAEIDALCDHVIRKPMETVELEHFEHLAAGDILFVDGSHRIFMNSDATVLFLDVLPRLKPGVLVHIHDIYLPYDYPPERAEWYYSEQYPLATALLAGHKGFRVVLPNHYAAMRTEIAAVLGGFWAHAELKGVPHGGTSFWLETTA